MAFDDSVADRIRWTLDERGIASRGELEQWVQLCLEYNPKAPSSKKRKKP